MKLTVLMLSQLPPPVHGASVMNQRVYLSKLIQEKFDVTHINIMTANNLDDSQKFRINKVTKVFKQVFTLLKICFRKRFDICYITLSTGGFAFYKDAVLWFLAAGFVKKRVLHLHTKGIISNNKSNRFKFKLVKFILAKSYAIALSDFLGIEIRNYVKKLYVLKNGIPLETNSISSTRGKHKIQIIYLSNLLVEKGIFEFIDVCASLMAKDVEFDAFVVGKELDTSISDVQSYVNSKKLGDYVKVVGPKYGIEKTQILQNSDVLLFPTHYKGEAFPLVILEAFQFGVIPVCSKEAAIPEMVAHGSDGFLFEYNDINGFASCIEAVSKDKAKLELLKERGRKKYYDEFTLDRFELNFVNILTNVSDA